MPEQFVWRPWSSFFLQLTLYRTSLDKLVVILPLLLCLVSWTKCHRSINQVFFSKPANAMILLTVRMVSMIFVYEVFNRIKCPTFVTGRLLACTKLPRPKSTTTLCAQSLQLLTLKYRK